MGTLVVRSDLLLFELDIRSELQVYRSMIERLAISIAEGEPDAEKHFRQAILNYLPMVVKKKLQDELFRSEWIFQIICEICRDLIPTITSSKYPDPLVLEISNRLCNFMIAQLKDGNTQLVMQTLGKLGDTATSTLGR